MKRCPECGREYDSSMMFCLDDGAELLYGPASIEEPATAVIFSPHVTSEDPTRSFRTSDIPAGSVPPISQAQRRSRPKLWLVAIGVAVLVLVGAFFGYRYLRTAGSGQIESIAVMPFVNASGNAEFEYLSDGITETLINSLSQVPNLAVKGRGSVFRYKGKDTEPKQIAADLGVQAVLNGRLQARGDSVTLSLDLVDAYTGNQIWGEQYERKLSEIAALQKEISRDVSNKLKTKLSGADQQNLAKGQTTDPEAYQLYLQGLYQWNKRTDDGVNKSREFFQKAIDKDPKYALAHAGLAASYVVIDFNPDDKKMAKAAALKALELDQSLGEAHAILANVAFYYEWDSETADREFKRSFELNPNYATTYHWYGETLAARGRFEESNAAYAHAVELDPVSMAIATDQGFAYFFARQYDRAIEHFKKLIEIEPGYVRTYIYLSGVYEEKRMFPESIEARRKWRLLEGADEAKLTERMKQLSDGYASDGEKGYWQAALRLALEKESRTKEPANPMDLAFLYSKLKDNDKAFQLLEKAFQERRVGMVFLNVEPAWENVRDDPRFADLIRRVGIKL